MQDQRLPDHPHLFRYNCFTFARHKREHGNNTSASKSRKLLEMHAPVASPNAPGTRILTRHLIEGCP